MLLAMGCLRAFDALAGASSTPHLDPEALRCRTAIAKSFSRLVAEGIGTLAACHRGRDLGRVAPGVDCNDLSIAGADSAGRFGAAAARLGAAIEKSCSGADDALVSHGFFLSCPEPCGTRLSTPNPLSGLDQVGDCLVCLARHVTEGLAAATLGLPDPGEIHAADARCRNAIADGYRKLMSSAHRAEFACQRRADALGRWDVADCVDEDPRHKAAVALGKAESGIAKACHDVALAGVDSCAVDTLENLRACLATTFDEAGDRTFAAAYQLPATICPSDLVMTAHAGCRGDGAQPDACTPGERTESSLSLGWTGLAHDLDSLDQLSLPLALDCPGTEAGSCGDCRVAGVSVADSADGGLMRCENAPWIRCDEPFLNDSDCGEGICAIFLVPPVPVSAGATPACVLNILDSDMGGIWNPDAGRAEFRASVRSKVHNGLGLTRPCPICRGDATGRDGVPGGVCVGGSRDGQPCDVQAFESGFESTDPEAPASGSSLDCPPAATANISGSGLSFALRLSTGSATMPFGDACDPPDGGRNCACGVCSHDETIPCNGDGECKDLSDGSTCHRGSPGAARAPNSCTGFACSPVEGAAARGECPDLDRYCSGVLGADGRGILACGSDEDCAAYVSGSDDPDMWLCPEDDCGVCTVSGQRSCFLDPIRVEGREDPRQPLLAGIFCVPPTASAGRNSAWGLPGPGEVQLDVRITPGF